MNMSFGSTRRQNRGNTFLETPLAAPQHTRLQNILAPVLDLVKSPTRSSKGIKVEISPKKSPSLLAQKFNDLSFSDPGAFSVQLKMKRRLGAGRRRLLSSRPRMQKSDCELDDKTCRKVHFECEEVTGDVIEYIIEPEIVLGQEDLERAWFSRTDLRHCRLRAQETCRFYVLSRPDYQDAMLRLLVQCGAQSTDEFLNKEMKKHRESFGAGDDEDINLIVDSEARGLEKRILNAMDLPFHRHKGSVEVALDTQRRLANVKHCDFDTDKRTRLIASQYSKSAEYATAWARRTAEVDALAVRYESGCIGTGTF